MTVLSHGLLRHVIESSDTVYFTEVTWGGYLPSFHCGPDTAMGWAGCTLLFLFQALSLYLIPALPLDSYHSHSVSADTFEMSPS